MKMLQLAHAKIEEYQMRDSDDKQEWLPVMLGTYNPIAVKLYRKYGYKVYAEINVDSQHKVYGLYYQYNKQDDYDKIVIDLNWIDLLPDITTMDIHVLVLIAILLLLSPFIILCLCVIVVLRLLNIGRFDV